MNRFTIVAFACALLASPGCMEAHDSGDTDGREADVDDVTVTEDTTSESATDTQPQDADVADTSPQILCMVDFPCEWYGLEASCPYPATFIRGYVTLPCEYYCGGQPCSGASCSTGELTPCPDETVCVEPTRGKARCAPVRETCGGPDHTACPDRERCLRRTVTQGDHETLCEVGQSEAFGFCDGGSTDEDELPPCGDAGR